MARLLRPDFDRNAAPRPALPSADRTADDQHRLRSSDLSRSRAPAPTGAPLYAPHSGGDARGDPDHAAARQPERGARLRREARRLDRGAARAASGSRALRAWLGAAAAGDSP